jgi:metallo-beta-lactamase family protein
MRLTFLGATGTVTGSKYLLETDRTRLLVDCGLYQGVKSQRNRNWRALEVAPASIDAVLLTHAHIDHSGLLPALVRDGFKGPIYATRPTTDLCEILLPDAAHIQEEDAMYANRKGFSRHQPALPLYTRADAEKSLQCFRSVSFGESLAVGDFAFRMQRAGHILGAASIEVSRGDRSILFSGDLGRRDDLLMHPPTPPASTDFIVIESTYGNRIHAREDPLEALADVLRETVDRGGILLIPSFAVGRTQTLLFCLHEIFRKRLAERVPVYVNSPMATSVTDLFRASTSDHLLPPDKCEDVCREARFVRSVDESRELGDRRDPMVIISASGMATGGRILHHLKSLAPDPRNTILLPGFQAAGTRGDSLARGVDTIKLHGVRVPVRARVHQLDIFSAHADQQGLLDWLAACERPPQHVFVTHGEPVAADTIRQLTEERLGFSASAPELGDSIDLDRWIPEPVRVSRSVRATSGEAQESP